MTQPLRRIPAFLLRRSSRISGEFKLLWKNYLYQSLLATAVVLLVFHLLTVENAVVIASIGSTAFIVFTMPRNISANPRRIIGGHLVGLLSGSACAVLSRYSLLSPIVDYSIAVGLSIFLMVALDVEHPPAGGTALGVAMTGFSPKVAVALLTSTIVLSLAHRLFRKYLKDLT